ncbi:hypothetical protein BD770DRAFT_441625 [Pilaira anomala]|nr:hypothetical protein BD770DRAFT_441625 [Pilaira anomala]
MSNFESGPLDTSKFDEEFTRERPALTPIKRVLNRVEQQEFQNFSYVGPKRVVKDAHPVVAPDDF